MILIKSVLHKNQNHYYYNIFLENCSYQLPKNNGNKLWMLYLFSKAININKTSASKKCNIFHYQCFLDKRFNFQPYVCNGCHNVFMMSMHLSDIAILSIKGADFCCIVNRIRKSEAINLM